MRTKIIANGGTGRRLAKVAAPKPVFTPTELATVQVAVMVVWQKLGWEALRGCAEAGEKLSNLGAIEFCVDAGNLVLHGGREGKLAEPLVTEAFEHNEYDKVLAAIGKTLRLV